MNWFIKFSCLIISANFGLADTIITTTLNSLEQRSAAVIDQADVLQTLMIDAFQNYNKYTSYMGSHKMTYPGDFVQFIADLTAYTDDTTENFPTSVFIESFPFSDFKTLMTAMPWYSSLLEKAHTDNFLLPTDYATVILTVTDSTAFPGISSDRPSATSSLVSSTSAELSISSSSPTSSLNFYSFKKESSSLVNLVSTTTMVTVTVHPSSSLLKKESLTSSSVSSVFSYYSTSTHNGAALIAIPGTLFTILILALF